MSETKRKWARAAQAAFAAAVLCLLAAVLAADGWMVSQRLLAVAAILAVVALVAALGTMP